MPAPAALEGDVRDLKTRIAAAKTDEATARVAADDLVAEIKTAGQDPFSDDAFPRIDAAYKAADGLKDEIEVMNDRLVSILSTEGAEVVAAAGGDVNAPEVRTFGERFLASGQYKHLVESGVLNMSATDIRFDPVEIASVDELRRVFTAATVDGSPLIPHDQRLTPAVLSPVRQPSLLDFITIGQTGREVVDYARQTTQTNAAANTAVGTASPESTMVFTKQTETVRRITTNVPVSRGSLADQGELRTTIDGILMGNVRRTAESGALSGNGVGENFTGIVNTAGIATQAKGVDTNADAIHKGITLVRIALENDVTAVGLHPTDYELLNLAKDSNGVYLNGGGWQAQGPRTIWGYPAIVSTVFTAGTAVVADWAKAVMWLRTGVEVTSGTSGTNFVDGLVTLLAEMRAAFALTQPAAAATVTGIA